MSIRRKTNTAPVVGFAAYSGSGKTTLLTQLLSILTGQGLRVGIVKHTHHSFSIDQPGKDSYRLREAGASQVMIGSGRQWAVIAEHDTGEEHLLEYLLEKLELGNLDLVLVEGFKFGQIPKIEVYRPALGKPALYPEDKHFIAVATDQPGELQTDLPVFDLNDPSAIAEFITDRFASVSERRVNE